MKEINGNKGPIIQIVLDGKIKVDEIVYSTVNRCKYKVVETINHQGEWVGIQEVKEAK